MSAAPSPPQGALAPAPSPASRGLLALLAAAVLAVAWGSDALRGAQDERFVDDSLQKTAVFVALNALGLALLALSLIPGPRRRALARVGLCGACAVFLGFLLELLTWTGIVDWRMALRGPDDFFAGSIKPWRNPFNERDDELIYKRPPHVTAEGSTFGDTVAFLGIATDRTYDFHLRYDHNGFRNERDLERADVAVIGDSFVECGLVAQPQLFTTLLEADLGAVVANLGVGGYAPQQELIVLRRYALPLEPKLVVWVVFDGNDVMDVRRFDSMKQEAGKTEAIHHGFWRRSLSENLLRLVRAATRPRPSEDSPAARRSRGILQASGRNAGAAVYFPYVAHPLSAEDEACVAELNGILAQAAQECASAGSRLLVVLAPEKFRVYRDLCRFDPDSDCLGWSLSDFPARLAQGCRASGVEFLDLTPALTDAARAGELVYYVDDGHWNEAGNAIAAAGIARAIRERALLQAPPGGAAR